MTRALAWSAILMGTMGGLLTPAPEVEAQSRGGSPAQQAGLFPDRGQPFFLAGRVVLEDGTPPPEPVPVVRTCGGHSPVPLGFTDAKGEFSFGGGSNLNAAMGAQNALGADPFASGYQDLTGCDLRAVATGYWSEAIDLGGRRLLDSPDVGTIVLRRLEGVLGSTFSRTTLRARKDARAAFEKGRARAREEKIDEAIREYERAVRIAPEFAAAWYELGLLRQVKGRFDEAMHAYQQAVQADPDFVKPYRQLGAIAFQEQDWPAVLTATDRLLLLDPVSYPDAYYQAAVASFYTNDLAKAETRAREATRLDAAHRIPRARYVLAAVLIEKRDYAAASDELRDYVQYAPAGPEVDQAKGMLEQLEARLATATR